MPPLTVDQECVEVIRLYAQPILPRDRPRFYERVTELLRGVEVGPGSYARACIEAQRSFLFAPPIDEQPHRPSAQVPRSPFRRRA